MGRTPKGSRTSASIREAAIEMFFTHGYQATTLRELAAACNLKVGSLYNHIESKDALLEEIMVGIMSDLLESLQQVVSSFRTPTEQLRAAIELHVSFHALRAKEVFIGNSEIRSLPPDARAEVIDLRDRYEVIIGEIVERGIETGEFADIDAKLAVYAIVAVCTHVSTWYQPGGRLDLDYIAEFHANFLLNALTTPSSNGDGSRLRIDIWPRENSLVD